MLAKLHEVIFLFLCEHSWDPPGFVMFQHCLHFSQADIQFCTQFHDHKALIGMNELIETFFILWYDRCSYLSEMWLIFHIAAVTTEMHLLPYCVIVWFP